MFPKAKNLWERIQRFDQRFVVDNHVPWDTYAPENSHAAFILGTTALSEKNKTLSIFLDSKGKRRAYRNVFLFRAYRNPRNRDSRLGQLIIDALDEWCLSVFDQEKMATRGANQLFPPPETVIAAEIESIQAIIREELIRVLCGRSRKVSIIPPLAERIQNGAASCFASYGQSIEVAHLSFALLLLRKPRARLDFTKKQRGGFMDSAIVKDALFFRASILTEDAGVREMGRYCGIAATMRPHKRPPAPRDKPSTATDEEFSEHR